MPSPAHSFHNFKCMFQSPLNVTYLFTCFHRLSSGLYALVFVVCVCIIPRSLFALHSPCLIFFFVDALPFPHLPSGVAFLPLWLFPLSPLHSSCQSIIFASRAPSRKFHGNSMRQRSLEEDYADWWAGSVAMCFLTLPNFTSPDLTPFRPSVLWPKLRILTLKGFWMKHMQKIWKFFFTTSETY